MVQQINLYHDALKPHRERWRAAHGLWVAGGTLALGWAIALAQDALSARRLAEAQQLKQQAATERAGLSGNSALIAAAPGSQAQAELERLRQLDAAQRRVRDALEAQAGSGTQGYTPYFTALSRQAQPTLWITGFSVSADGQGLELQGRMTDPAVLPGYLRKLNGEAQFKGRSFAQLSLKTAEAGADAPAGFTEFQLRSQPAAAEASR
jgi:Tfp pilus assembly protein PilN